MTKTFGPKRAVDRLDLQVEEGSLIGLIGPNGAGKTTTIRMVMSILFPDSGSLSVLGRPTAIESKDRIGYLPEERGVYKKMRVLPFLKYMSRLKGRSPPDLDRIVRGWLERVGLTDCARKKCEELSKGMQQKVQFVAAVIHEPDLVILDEPFSGLDPVNSRLLQQLIREQHERGRTIVFSTHQMSQAEALCDRVVMIHQGRKVLDATPRDIRARFESRALLFEPAREDADAGRIASLPEVASLERGDHAWVVQLRPGVDLPATIARLSATLPAQRVEAVRPTLEDVFIQIVHDSSGTPEEREHLRAQLHATPGLPDSARD